MKFILLTGLVGLGLSLAAFAPDTDATRTKAAREGAAHVELALTAPMATLYSDGRPEDEMAMGLALLAGRTVWQKPDVAEKTLARVMEADAKVTAALAAYVAKHPRRDPNTVNWWTQAQVEGPDSGLVPIYLRRVVPDFWLRRVAMTAYSHTTVTYNGPGTAASVSTVQRAKLHDKPLSSAVHCIAAVNEAAGIPLFRTDLPPGIVRLTGLTGHAYADKVARELAQPQETRAWFTGKAACGDDATFERFVALRKAAAAPEPTAP